MPASMGVAGGPGLMVVVHNFSYGLLTPVLAYVMSCLGCFLGLRCTTRARPCTVLLASAGCCWPP
jgi:hypothetical protein